MSHCRTEFVQQPVLGADLKFSTPKFRTELIACIIRPTFDKTEYVFITSFKLRTVDVCQYNFRKM